jgi:hypothetical protein
VATNGAGEPPPEQVEEQPPEPQAPPEPEAPVPQETF